MTARQQVRPVMANTIIWLLLVSLALLRCEKEIHPKFSKEVLQEKVIDLDGNKVSIKEVLEKTGSDQIVLSVWASWCGDCLAGLPDLKALQKNNGDVPFVFLSLDRSLDSWKKGIKRYEISGSHYFLESGWDGKFGDFIGLDWIPRYMIVDREGNIEIFEEVKARDIELKKQKV